MSDRINDIDNREETNENLSSEEILNRVAETLDDYRGDDVDLTKYIPVKWLEANEELYYTNDPQDRQIRKHYMDVRSSWEISGANQWKELLAGKISEKSLYWGKNHIDYMRDTTDMYCYNGVNLDSLHYIIPGKELAPYDGTVTLHRFCNEALQYRYAIYVLSTEVKRVPLREKDAMIKEWEDLYKNDPITFNQKLEEYKRLSCKDRKDTEAYHIRQMKKCSTCIHGDSYSDTTGVHYRCTLRDDLARECKSEQVNHWE